MLVRDKRFKGFKAWNGVEGDDIIAELLEALGDYPEVSSGAYVVLQSGSDIRIARIIAHKVKE